MCASMAASLGLGHEAYYPPPAASMCFPPDLVAANNYAATTNFLLSPATAVPDDYYFPFTELGVPPSPAHYSPPHQIFAENEMNMRFVDDGRMMMSRTAGNGSRRTSRIGFRTMSEVDVLDDGFKWRKYGKKAVKSSPNPRNYYRCSVEGCGVKKRVERDHDDPRYVVTTYDGVHNHAAGAGAAAAGHQHAPPQAPLPYAAGTWAAAPTDAWRMQLQGATTAHSSESSY